MIYKDLSRQTHVVEKYHGHFTGYYILQFYILTNYQWSHQKSSAVVEVPESRMSGVTTRRTDRVSGSKKQAKLGLG